MENIPYQLDTKSFYGDSKPFADQIAQVDGPSGNYFGVKAGRKIG
jgi:hypothetical protein